MTQPEPWPGTGGPQPWSTTPPPPGFYPPMYPPPRQPMNTMAIVALVCAFVFAPLGIVFGHIALSQIRRTNEDGKGLAIAGLVIGYAVTGLFLLLIIGWLIFIVWLSIAVDNNTTYNSIFTPTTTTSFPSETDDQAIRRASAGDCIRMVDESDGTVSDVRRVSCTSSSATHRVTETTTSESDCPGAWVATTDYSVVLCLVRE